MKIEYPNIEGSGEIYLTVMKSICGDTTGKSMVDLMCYRAPYTPLLGFKERTYVDIQRRPLDFKSEEEFFIHGDVIDFLKQIKTKRYDVSICSDGIEHLDRIMGVILWTRMSLCSKKQIGFTPLGPLNITNDHNPDSHRSSWLPGDLFGTASVVFPDFHKSIGHGAFFFWDCENIKEDFERVKKELSQCNFKTHE